MAHMIGPDNGTLSGAGSLLLSCGLSSAASPGHLTGFVEHTTSTRRARGGRKRVKAVSWDDLYSPSN
jgi:hypothetical protein